MKLCRMMGAQGYEVYHLGVAGAQVPGATHIDLMTQAEHLALMGLTRYHEEETALIGNLAQTGTPWFRQFNFTLREELKEHMQPGDVLCLSMGFAHDAAWKGLPLIESGEVAVLESGIGYPNPFSHYRVYESAAWMHWVMGNEGREGMSWESPRREWVVPNSFDLDEWPVRETLAPEDRDTVVYLGRLQDVKGLELIPKLATLRPDLRFRICGQGDPSPYLTQPNIEYVPPISGVARAEYLGRARCGIFPSRFVEPFCGAAVECMLTGTPVLTSDFGAFTETVIPLTSGMRCRTLANWLGGLDHIHRQPHITSRPGVAQSARERYGLDAVAPMYERVFEEIRELMAERNA